MPPTIILLLSAFNISSINLYKALSADEEVLKPNYSTTKILLIVICCKSLSYIIFSKTFENEVSKKIGL
jgi:hypothetical protein